MELRLDFLKFLHLLFQCFDFFFQPLRFGLGHFGRCSIRRIHCRQISIDALLNLLHACLHFALSEVAVAIIDGFEFAAVDGDDRLGEEIEVATKNYELTAYAANGFTVVFAKVGNGFEVRSQTPR
ncbi:hypothetical protein D9M71_582490 [compost metagenome]